MASIVKRIDTKGTSYRVNIRLKGFPSQNASFKTEEEAKKWAFQVESALLEAREKNFRPDFTYTFSEIANRYKREHLTSLSPSESHKREQQINFWIEEFGRNKINEITPQMIETVLYKLSKSISVKNKKPLSPNTLQRKLAALSHIFTFCVIKWKILEKNPMILVEKPVGENCRRSKVQGEITVNDVFTWLSKHGIGDNEITRIKCQLKS